LTGTHRWKYFTAKCPVVIQNFFLERRDVIVRHLLVGIDDVRVVREQHWDAERIEHLVQRGVHVKQFLEPVCVGPRWVDLRDDCRELPAQVIILRVDFEFLDDVCDCFRCALVEFDFAEPEFKRLLRVDDVDAVKSLDGRVDAVLVVDLADGRDNAAEKVTQGIVRGKITPTDGEKVMNVLEIRSRFIEKGDFERAGTPRPVQAPPFLVVPGNEAA
jgi:hypothetical protein